MTPDTPFHSRYQLLARASSAGLLALMAITWRVWLPSDKFPQIPLFSPFRISGYWMDWLLLATLFVSLLIILLTNDSFRWKRQSCALVVISLAGLIGFNQHRLQPWVYLSMIGFTAIASCNSRQTLRVWRWLLISVYVFSGINKIDFTFQLRLGNRLLEAALDLVGIEIGTLPVAMREVLIQSMPIAELAVAALLLLPWTRKVGIYASTLLHGVLIAMLGLGLRHKSGVLLWNLIFAIQIWIVFGGQQVARKDRIKSRANPLGTTVQAICMLVLLLPFGEFYGLWDHWPSWALYSERVEKTEIFVRRTDVPKLTDCREFVARSGANEEWVQLYYEQWALNRVGVPVYPEVRFSLGVAIHVAAEIKDPTAVKAVVYEVPNRATGARVQYTLPGEKMSARLEKFWLNGYPRTNKD